VEFASRNSTKASLAVHRHRRPSIQRAQELRDTHHALEGADRIPISVGIAALEGQNFAYTRSAADDFANVRTEVGVRVVQLGVEGKGASLEMVVMVARGFTKIEGCVVHRGGEGRWCWVLLMVVLDCWEGVAVEWPSGSREQKEEAI
jgi:hypothetical protein